MRQKIGEPTAGAFELLALTVDQLLMFIGKDLSCSSVSKLQAFCQLNHNWQFLS